MLPLGYLTVFTSGLILGLFFNRLLIRSYQNISYVFEVITGLLAIFFAYTVDLFDNNSIININRLPYIVLAVSMAPVIVIDAKNNIIPNEITYTLLFIGILSSFLPDGISPVYSLSGVLLGGGILYFIGFFGKLMFKKEGMGGGDVKLMAAIGAFLGPLPVIFVLFSGSLLALFFILIQALFGKPVFGKQIPFGPYLAVGLFITLILMFKTDLICI